MTMRGRWLLGPAVAAFWAVVAIYAWIAMVDRIDDIAEAPAANEIPKVLQ